MKSPQKAVILIIGLLIFLATLPSSQEDTLEFQQAYRIVRHGYALAVQNERGRYFS